NHDYYASADEALERLAKNADNYDVVILNAAHIPYAVSRGLLDKIPSDAVKNFDALAEPLRQHRFLTPGGDLYGIAWTWGMTGLSRGVSKAAPGAVHWSDLWDRKFKGRVGIRNNAADAVEIAALSLGLDPASLETYADVEARLADLAGQV